MKHSALTGSWAFAGALFATAGNASAADIQLSVWTNLTTAAQTEIIQRHVNVCLKDMPGVTAKFETVPYGSMYTRLITSIKRDDVPNLMNTLEGVVAFVQAKNALVPLDDVIDSLDRSDFLASYLNAASKDGKVWGIPDWALHQSVWYRKDLFKAAGISIPKSWDELAAAAKKLSVGSKQYGFAVPMGRTLVAPQTYFQILYSAGGYIFDPKTGDYAYADKRNEAIAAMKLMLTLYKESSPPASLEWNIGDYRQAFVSGLVAMTNEWGAVVGMANEQNPKMLENMGVFAFPGPSANTPPAAALNGGFYYFIGKSSDAKVAATKTLLKCMYAVDRVAERANSRPVFAIPATRSAFQSATYKSNPMVQKFQPEMEYIFNNVMGRWYRYGMEAGLNPLAGQIEATTFVGDAIQNAALGKITAEQAVDEIDRQLQLQISLLQR